MIAGVVIVEPVEAEPIVEPGEKRIKKVYSRLRNNTDTKLALTKNGSIENEILAAKRCLLRKYKKDQGVWRVLCQYAHHDMRKRLTCAGKTAAPAVQLDQVQPANKQAQTTKEGPGMIE